MTAATAIDLNTLGFAEPDLIKEDWDKYDDTASQQSTYTGPAPEGVYTFKLPQLTLALEKDGGNIVNPREGQENYLTLNCDIAIASGPYAGQVARYQRISIKKFPNSRASQAGNLLKAAGIKMQPTSNEQWLQAFAALSGKTFQGTLQWQGKDKQTGQYIRGARNFPTGEDGKKLSVVERTDANGESYRVYANNSINWFETPPAARKG